MYKKDTAPSCALRVIVGGISENEIIFPMEFCALTRTNVYKYVGT